ncbi:serine hydrolase, partial [Acinetobacter baumannii]|nr:serine hydrolase [Acinetobacter baumannii]
MKALCVAIVSIFLVSCASAPPVAHPGFADRDIEALMARGKVVGLA